MKQRLVKDSHTNKIYIIVQISDNLPSVTVKTTFLNVHNTSNVIHDIEFALHEFH